ncbi:2-hydroxychromene-2-carboxylate isomerase [Pseudomaricurvus alkylphenolicus]|uniref:2-hydroxychromene-2-carboxylate isomerase n=1 Tax=Pseudomaricurvus alkylphenolicus TaxID=1306991 RepID=UPI001420F21F|nr:2-hydroxychromene-2-carboxylate isomerase [Pseudomaricurvus alkylphenolicus]NIB44695.1 2-hydroxychromene-2-carboxylate isomerase [Pseudomaricurvus alkylphenolicus]
MNLIEFYYDYVSPTSYLAYKRLLKMAQARSLKIDYKPVQIGGIFKQSGNSSPVSVPAKLNWMWDDMSRHARRHNIPMMKNDHFPLNSVYAMRGALVAKDLNCLAQYNEVMFRAMWEQGANISDIDVMTEVLAQAGLDAKSILEAVQSDAIKARLRADTAAAVERGVFGVPTMIVDNELHFGQDRLDFVLEAAER